MNKNTWVKVFLKLYYDFKIKRKLSLGNIYLGKYQTKVGLIIQDIQQSLKLNKET